MCKDNHMDEKQLLQSCLEGNVEDFKKVIDKYKGKALALAWNYMGNREDAEDACQDAFLKAYLNSSALRYISNMTGAILLVPLKTAG